MHFTTFTTSALLLASLSLSVALPAETNDISINPTHAVLENFARADQDALNPNNINKCGPKDGKCIKANPDAGLCCSQHGWCGQTKEHCGKGCQSKYGRCFNKKDPAPVPPTNPQPGRCGPQFGHSKCANNQCCSAQGYCGVGRFYCSNPGECLRGYGRCDADASPAGHSTSKDPRHHVGKISYRLPITKCKKPGTIALTFDDGPSDNTQELLNLLAEHNAKATFFVGANNNHKGEIDLTDRWIEAIKRMDAEGHQVGSHTWSHPHLDKLPSHQRKEEMYKTERALANIIGKYPSYMRAPYVECSAKVGCMKDMSDLGYHVVDWEVDSGDWDTRKSLAVQKRTITDAFQKKRKDDSILLIQHDTYAHAIELTKHVLEQVKSKGWKAVTVAECVGEPVDHTYRYPTYVEAAPIAKNGCVVSQAGFCGQIKSFDDKAQCFKSERRCLQQLRSPAMEQNKASRGYRHMKEVCHMEFLFCSQCGKKGASPCKSNQFAFRRRQ